jgi:hypothetical protein
MEWSSSDENIILCTRTDKITFLQFTTLRISVHLSPKCQLTPVSDDYLMHRKRSFSYHHHHLKLKFHSLNQPVISSLVNPLTNPSSYHHPDQFTGTVAASRSPLGPFCPLRPSSVAPSRFNSKAPLRFLTCCLAAAVTAAEC